MDRRRGCVVQSPVSTALKGVGAMLSPENRRAKAAPKGRALRNSFHGLDKSDANRAAAEWSLGHNLPRCLIGMEAAAARFCKMKLNFRSNSSGFNGHLLYKG